VPSGVGSSLKIAHVVHHASICHDETTFATLLSNHHAEHPSASTDVRYDDGRAQLLLILATLPVATAEAERLF